MSRFISTLMTSTCGILMLMPAASASELNPAERIDAAVHRALSAGIPVSLLENLIAQGKAKGVPMDRLATAIERREATLHRVLEATKHLPDMSEGDFAVSSHALENGVSEAVLQTISETTPQERRMVAIAALTELVAQGIAPQKALDRVTWALEQGRNPMSEVERGRSGGFIPPGVPGADPGRPDHVPPVTPPAPPATPGAPVEPPTPPRGNPRN